MYKSQYILLSEKFVFQCLNAKKKLYTSVVSEKLCNHYTI